MADVSQKYKILLEQRAIALAMTENALEAIDRILAKLAMLHEADSHDRKSHEVNGSH